jgi:CO/xanthine dehydrogenase Mo-binding subunit
MNLDNLMPVDAAVSTASKEFAAAMSRRVFLKSSVTAGGGLLLGVSLPMLPALAAAAGANAGTEAGANGHDFEPNAFIRLDPNGIVTLIIPNVEMGQGTFTSMPMLIAEDMEVDLSSVRVENAPADDKRYANPLLGFQVTGGSTSVRGAWVQLRKAGATARVLLVSAAAQRWGVPAGECEAAHGAVTHKASNRRLGYGELAGAAARLPIPADAPLKDAKQFRLIGTSPARLETQPAR